MFTGIVQGVATLTRCIEKPGLKSFTLAMPGNLAEELTIGASIAIEGACLTVTEINANAVSFDVINETLTRTMLSELNEKDKINIERSACFGDEIGGHILSGHIHGVAEIINIESPENNRIIHFRVPNPWIKYIFPKAYIALGGASLTIVDVDKSANTFSVHLIPETLRQTTFAEKLVGDKVNFEIDQQTLVTVETVELLCNDFLK